MNNRIIQIIFVILISVISHAQTTVNKTIHYTYCLVMPSEIDGFTQNSLDRLKDKIIQSVSLFGICGEGLHSDFVIYPVITFNEAGSSSGMKELNFTSLDLSLYIKNISDKKIFSSYTTRLTGTGQTTSSAISNCINGFKINDPKLTEFYSEASKKISEYYTLNCSSIISKADMLGKMEKYDEAFALLMSIPKEISPCYEQIIAKSISIYKSYVNKNCMQTLISAESQIAEKNYSRALDLLSTIDPTSDCFIDSRKLIKQIETSISLEEKRKWDDLNKKYANEIELEKLRINSITEIAKAYYQSKPTTLNYYEVYIVE